MYAYNVFNERIVHIQLVCPHLYYRMQTSSKCIQTYLELNVALLQRLQTMHVHVVHELRLKRQYWFTSEFTIVVIFAC